MAFTKHTITGKARATDGGQGLRGTWYFSMVTDSGIVLDSGASSSFRAGELAVETDRHGSLNVDLPATGIGVPDGWLYRARFVSHDRQLEIDPFTFELTADSDIAALMATPTEIPLTPTLVERAETAAAEARAAIPDADGWPVYLYGASYSVLANSSFTAGNHYAEQVAAAIGAGAVTSYGVNGRRALDLALTMLNGVAFSGITGVIAAGKWPGTSARSGLVVLDDLGNDVMYQAAMNGSSIAVREITGTAYLNSLKATWRAIHALASSESRVEDDAHVAESGTWGNAAVTWGSAGQIVASTVVGSYREYSLTPPQSGPMAGKVYLITAGDLPTASEIAKLDISVDGVAATSHQPERDPYTGHNGQSVKGHVQAIPITLPVDGNAHTVRVTHAGSAGQYALIDCFLIPSTDPNPVAVMGVETPPIVHASGMDATDVALYKANLAKVTAARREVIAEFGNAFYVPSTMTENGLWSGDGLHPNDRGMAQRAADLQAAIATNLRARLAARVLAGTPDAEFPVT